MHTDYDYLVIGSGGSDSALWLAEKGYQVAVIEQGRPPDLPRDGRRAG